ncbi:cyclophilin type peptidyl-prolyl cis-trans isomerase/CLD [Diplocarpon rosae]|nr:cyclophilin type peptidyl-prolyl cis-trans isomerase/CLD [Diplocarpon rosae]
MSALYNLEPQPTASCILHTTSGDISLELWAQQIPLTCRNFLQLCLDGYYDNTIFHRLVPGFILQGGDPTGTGSGGESIYDGGQFSESREENGIWPMEDRRGANAGRQGVGFKDEFHSRIKFNRRGLLGMANEGPDSNGSQFFITLGDTPELQGKNTLFGRVEGETIYNVARMGEAEVGENDRPLYPTKITSVEVLVNPFKDMARRVRTAPIFQEPKTVEKKKKRKAGKQLLSFEDEEGEGEAQPVIKKAKYDTRIVIDDEEAPQESKPKRAEKKVEKRAEKPNSAEISPEPAPLPRSLPNRAAKPERDISSSPEPVQKFSTLLERTNAQIAELKASMKRNISAAPAQQKKKSALESMIPKTSVKARKRRPGESLPTDQSTLDLLKAFQTKLQNAPPEKEVPKPEVDGETGEEVAGASDEEAALCDLHFIANCQSCKKWDAEDEKADDDDDDDGVSWMSHALSFKEDKLGKDLSYRKKAEDELVVIDPREKARTLKEEKRAQREAKPGGSGRAWDQSRNEKLAKSSALAGRGAR